MAGPPQLPTAYLTVKEVAHHFKVSVPSVRRWAATSATVKGVFVPAIRGRWHPLQIQIMDAVRRNDLPLESAEARWRYAKIKMIEALPPEE